MTRTTRALRTFAFALPLAAAAAPVAAQIIPLPLNPVIAAGQRTCTATTPSGLGYSELRGGTSDKKAGAGDFVLVNYIGYLAADGAVFDQGMRTPMAVDDVIPGFTEGLKLIPQGGVTRLCVPAALGYGAQGGGPIPANADLVFQVEVVDMRTRAELQAMEEAQATEAPPSEPAAPQ